MIATLTHFLEATTVVQKWRILRPLERRLERDMAIAFRTQGRAFAEGFSSLQSKFREAVTDSDWNGIFNAAAQETESLFVDPIQAAAQVAMESAAETLISDLAVDYSFSLKNPRAVTYVEAHGAELVKGINETTRGYLQTVIRQGVDEGWSYNKIAKAITERYREFAVGKPQEHIQSRAHLIAVQECGEAYEAGNEIVVSDLASAGLKMEKKWDTVGDRRVSQEICAPNEAQGWIPFDEPFQSGHMRPLGHVACRCTALYRRAPG